MPLPGSDSPMGFFNLFVETVAPPGQMAPAVHMDLSVASLKCALHRPATRIEPVD